MSCCQRSSRGSAPGVHRFRSHLTGTSKAAEPDTRDPRPFRCPSVRPAPASGGPGTRGHTHGASDRPRSAGHPPADHRNDTTNGGDTHAARHSRAGSAAGAINALKGLTALAGLSDLAGRVADEQLPCRVNDPELFFADSPADVEYGSRSARPALPAWNASTVLSSAASHGASGAASGSSRASSSRGSVRGAVPASPR